MKLFVLRHGKAADGFPDEQRELTERGRADLSHVLSSRRSDVGQLDKVQCSPLLRARQTAEIARGALTFEGPCEINEYLVPWASPLEFLNSLDDNLESLLVASHQPFVSELVEYLTDERIAMPTSTLVLVDVEYPAQGGGNVVWVETR